MDGGGYRVVRARGGFQVEEQHLVKIQMGQHKRVCWDPVGSPGIEGGGCGV